MSAKYISMISSTSVPISINSSFYSKSYNAILISLSGLSLINLGNLNDNPTSLVTLSFNLPFPSEYSNDYVN